MADKIDLLPGTLDLMVLRALQTSGQQHGYGIARWIESISEQQIVVNLGTIYASLVRLQQRGWITAEWGVSENNRRAKFYQITDSGRTKLVAESEAWRKLSGVIETMLGQQVSEG